MKWWQELAHYGLSGYDADVIVFCFFFFLSFFLPSVIILYFRFFFLVRFECVNMCAPLIKIFFTFCATNPSLKNDISTNRKRYSLLLCLSPSVNVSRLCVCVCFRFYVVEDLSREYNRENPLICFECLKWWDIKENGKHYHINRQIFKTCVWLESIQNIEWHTVRESLFGKFWQWLMSHVQIFSICVTLVALLCAGHTINILQHSFNASHTYYAFNFAIEYIFHLHCVHGSVFGYYVHLT